MSTATLPRRASIESVPRPVTGWRRLLRDSMLVGGSSLVCDALGAVTSLLFRTLLDPTQMGLWQGLKTLLGYGNFANLGVSKGVARELTVSLGRGDQRAAARQVALGQTANLVSSAVYAAGLLAAAGWMLRRGAALGGAWAIGLTAIAALTFLQRHVTYQITLLRCRQEFGRTSAVAILEASLTLVVGSLLTWRFGLVGLYGATMAVMLASSAVLARGGAGRLGWQWAPAELARLAGVGAPILVASVLAALFRSLDRWFVLALPEGEFQLGCYSAALLVTTQLYGVANALSIVLAPRYGQWLGRTGSPRQVAQLAARSLEPLSAALGLAAALALLVAPPLLGAILPAYQSGLAALAWLAPGTVCLGLALPLQQYLIAVGGQRRSVAALCLGLLTAAAGNYLAVRSGAGLAGIAAATALSNALYWLCLMALSIWPELKLAQRGRYLAVSAAAMGLPLLSASLALPESSPLVGWTSLLDWRLWNDLLPRAAAVLAIWLGAIGVGWTYGGWGGAWRQEAAS